MKNGVVICGNFSFEGNTGKMTMRYKSDEEGGGIAILMEMVFDGESLRKEVEKGGLFSRPPVGEEEKGFIYINIPPEEAVAPVVCIDEFDRRRYNDREVLENARQIALRLEQLIPNYGFKFWKDWPRGLMLNLFHVAD